MLYLMIRRRSLDHVENNKDEAVEMNDTYLRVDPGDATLELEVTQGCHSKF